MRQKANSDTGEDAYGADPQEIFAERSCSASRRFKKGDINMCQETRAEKQRGNGYPYAMTIQIRGASPTSNRRS